MKEKKKNSYGVPTTGPLPLLLFATADHPDRELRNDLRARLEGWLEGLRPRHSKEEVERKLMEFRGTPLEPFELKGSSLRTAVFLTRLAFTSEGGQSRIRINSSSKPFPTGGLVLTHNLGHYFIERLACARRTKTPKSHWAFNPGVVAETGKYPARLPAQGWIGDHGFEAEVDLGSFGDDSWNPTKTEPDEVLKHSKIFGNPRPLLREGFDVWVHQDKLHVAIARPELMMKLAPKLTSGEGLWLELNQYDENEKDSKIQLHMRFQGESRHPLTAQVVLGKTDLGGWIHTGCLSSPELPGGLSERLEQWLPACRTGNSVGSLKKAA